MGYVLLSSFGALLTSYLSVTHVQDVIKEPKDLLEQGLSVYVHNGGSAMDFFRLGPEGSAQRQVWEERMKDEDHYLAPTEAEMADRFMQQSDMRSAGMFSYTAIIEPMVTKNPEKACQLKFSNSWMSGLMGIAFKKDLPYLHVFNWQLQRFEELGILDQIKGKWYSWDFDQFCRNQGNEVRPLVKRVQVLEHECR